jgi:hypothetical protein
MASATKGEKAKRMPRATARIFQHQVDFIKGEAKKSKGALTEGEIHRQLLDEAIAGRKKKK